MLRAVATRLYAGRFSPGSMNSRSTHAISSPFSLIVSGALTLPLSSDKGSAVASLISW